MRVIGVEYGNTRTRETLEDLALGARDVFNRAEQTDMRGHRVVDHRHIGMNQPRQIINFTGVVHAHFKHGELMRLAQAQHHQRYTDVVVKIAFGVQHRLIRPCLHTQDGGQHFLHGSFAVAASHRHDGNLEP